MTEKADLWQKLAAIRPEEAADLEIEVERVFPEQDERGYPIAGFCCSVSASNLTKAALMEKVGGGTYRLRCRKLATGEYFGQTTIKFPGLPKVLLPGSENTRKLSPATGVATEVQPGIDVDLFRRGVEYAERQSELKELRESIRALERKLSFLHSSGNGNGNGAGGNSQFIETLKMFKELGLISQDDEALKAVRLLDLLDKRESRGFEKAKELYEKLVERGVDPDAVSETKLLDLLGELLKAKSAGAAIATKPGRRPATIGQVTNTVFVQIRDGIAQILTEEIEPAAGSLVAGSKTQEELFSNIRKLIQFVNEQLSGESDIADAEKQPGENAGENSPGAQDDGQAPGS